MADFREIQRASNAVRWVKTLIAAAVLVGAIWTFLQPMVEHNAPGAGLDGASMPVAFEDLPSPGSRASVVDGAWIFVHKGQQPAGEGGPWLQGEVVSTGVHHGETWVQLRLDEDYAGLRSVWVTGDSVFGH